MQSFKQLEHIKFLEPLSDEGLALLANAVEVMSFDDGAALLDERTSAAALFFILDGRVNIYKRIAGQGSFLTILEKGDVFGEVSFVDERECSASASAVGKVNVAKLTRQAFDALAKDNPQLGLNFLLLLMKELSRKFRAVNEGLDLKSCEQTIFDLIADGTTVKIATDHADYICKILYMDKAKASPLLRIESKDQQILVPFHQVRAISLPNRYGQL